MDIFHSDLCFKESRNYLQGPDIYNDCMDRLSSLCPSQTFDSLRFIIHQFASHQYDLIVGSTEELSAYTLQRFAEIALTGPENNYSAVLVETEYPVTCRNPYPEEEIQRLCSITDKAISIAEATRFTPIEVIVSMTKQLHTQLYPPLERKWIFTRLDLDRPLNGTTSSSMTIQLKFNLNNRLTKSSIIQHGTTLGSVYFSLL